MCLSTRSTVRPGHPSEVPCRLDQCGYNVIVQARVIEVHELMHGGAFVEAVGICDG
jgi:hypothetical protein